MNIPFTTSATCVLDAAGAGQVRIGPMHSAETWAVRRVAVRVAPVPPATAPVLEPEARVYRGAAVDEMMVDGTYTGSTNSTGVDLQMMPGDVITVAWVYGDPGATATATVSGTKTVPG